MYIEGMSLGQNTYMEKNIILETAEIEVDFEKGNRKRAFGWRVLRDSTWTFRFHSRCTFFSLEYHVLKGEFNFLYEAEEIALRVMAAV
jgi:hypothetical protein